MKNHALVDGNKRLGWLATAVFLELNGVTVMRVSNGAVYRFVIAVAAGHDDVDVLAVRLRRLVERS